MTLNVLLSFIVTLAISACIMPILIKVGKDLDIVAHMNKRTVHKHEIVRIGGYGVFIATMIGAVIFLKTDNQINSILIAGFLVFMVGLIDDVHDLSPKIKVLVELIAACIVIFWGGVYLKGFDVLPGNWQIPLSIIITILWIIGVTNAINLIDGLDGLSAGISIIVLFTISMTSILSGRNDIAALALVLAGALGGFLIFNFHPAKIFLGDCGALYVGFMISVISLLGFGYSASAFFTLGAPIIVLMVPIMDTLIAIIRRKVHHKSFSEADRGHLHHNLMFKLQLGQVKSVLVLYAVTFLFSLTSYIYYYNSTIGILLFIFLMIIFEIFVEVTNMISRKYKPLLTIANIFIRSDKLPKIKMIERYRLRRTPTQKRNEHIIELCVVFLLVGGCIYYVQQNKPEIISSTQTKKTPYQKTGNNDLLDNIYERLDSAYQSKQRKDECQLVAAYFVVDYFSFKGKETNQITSLDYLYPSVRDSFSNYAKTSFYQYQKDYSKNQVTDYNIVSYSPSKVTLSGLEDYDYYNVLISYTFKTDIPNVQTSTNVTLIKIDGRYYVVGVDNA